MSMQSLDIKRRSATTTPPPGIREPVTGSVAKLIDVSKCIGCKACQSACMEWNDLRDEIGTNVGVYDNPADLTEHSWTVMRFSEYENPQGDLERLIRKGGRMHREDPGWQHDEVVPDLQFTTLTALADWLDANTDHAHGPIRDHAA